MDLEKVVEELRELLDTKQYTGLRQELMELNEADIAAIMEEMEEKEMLKIFRILPKDLAAEVFAYMEVENQQFIITSLSERDAANIIDNLMADDATDFLEEMPASVVKKLLSLASPETRRDINLLLRYPEDSAGSIMTVEFIDLKENLTVENAIERIRNMGLDSETINICYVLDSRRTLIGTVALRYLLLSPSDAVIGDIMNENVISINTMMDQEEVARQFQKYDFTAMPVVDQENRLVGIITVDDIVDILTQEATEDIEMMAAILPTDKPYMRTGVWETWMKRIPWLLLLMVSSTFTERIISSAEDALSACVVLTAYIPMLMGTGGNAGGQSSGTIIRGLSLNEIEFEDMFKVIWKELRVAFLCGLSLFVVCFAKLMLFDKVGLSIAVVICITLVCTLLIAKTVGSVLPMLAQKIGLDPAVMASPFITTIVDALSLIIYFNVAVNLLGL
ncbi:MAG: magnesium transporter [Lachnospiraceae bacterium]|nr:magnesium transporter [Lachnospiraceae bacterium]